MTIEAMPGRTLKGVVDFISPVVDEATRTAKVRLKFDNRDAVLKPGMYGTIQITHELSRGLALPEEALIDTGTRKIVFVATGEGRFEPREVQVGGQVDAFYQVLSGLSSNDAVVIGAHDARIENRAVGEVDDVVAPADIETERIFGPETPTGPYKHPASITELANGDLALPHCYERSFIPKPFDAFARSWWLEKEELRLLHQILGTGAMSRHRRATAPRRESHWLSPAWCDRAGSGRDRPS
jgi:hypothetical protein